MSNKAVNSKITEEKLDRLKTSPNFSTASFAIWLGDGEKNINKKIEDSLGELKSNVILLGLNPSDSKPKPFDNFHNSIHDTLIKDTISECEALKGAYMTDISQKVGSNSNDIKVSDKDIETFKEQLEILGNKEYFIVCFGDKAFNELLKGKFVTIKLDDYTLHCCKVPHFRRRKLTKEEHKKKFKSELGIVNKLIQKNCS